MTNKPSPESGSRPTIKISNVELTDDQLREVEKRLDHMLDIAWSVYQTISADPKRLAALRRYLTEVRNDSKLKNEKGRTITNEND
jgi:hypothetical protein